MLTPPSRGRIRPSQTTPTLHREPQTKISPSRSMLPGARMPTISRRDDGLPPFVTYRPFDEPKTTPLTNTPEQQPKRQLRRSRSQICLRKKSDLDATRKRLDSRPPFVCRTGKLNKSRDDFYESDFFDEIPPRKRPDMSRRFKDPDPIVPKPNWELARTVVDMTKFKLAAAKCRWAESQMFTPPPTKVYTFDDKHKALIRSHNDRKRWREETIKDECDKQRRRSQSVIVKGQKMLKAHPMPPYLVLLTQLMEKGVALSDRKDQI